MATALTIVSVGIGSGLPEPVGAAPAQVRVTVAALPSLSGAPMTATSVNDQGTVIGYAGQPGSATRAVAWLDGQLTELAPGATTSLAMGLNRFNRISLTTDPSGTPRALVWRSGRLTDISGGLVGTRAGQVNDLGQVLVRRRPTGGHDIWSFGSFTPIVAPGNAFNEAVALNNRGRVAGSWYAPTSGGGFRIQAFTWYRGTFTDLGSLAAGQTQARGLNESPQVVGVSQMPGGADHAFIWQSGSMRDLGTLGGSMSTVGFTDNVNESGQVIGTSTTAAGQTHGFIWQNGTMRDLGTLGGPTTQPMAVNNQGQVVGTSTTASGQTHAFLWQAGVMTDLGTLGGTFSSATDINENGQIVGTSTTAAGMRVATVWTIG